VLYTLTSRDSFGDTTSARNCQFRDQRLSRQSDCNVTTATLGALRLHHHLSARFNLLPAKVRNQFSIPIVDDSFAEGNESFSVSLNNGFGTSLGAPNNGDGDHQWPQ